MITREIQAALRRPAGPGRGDGSCLEKARNSESCGSGFGTPGLLTRGRPAPNARRAARCAASASASASWRPWRRVALSPCSATASTWTGGGAETPSSGAACGTVSASAAGGREGGRARAGSQGGAPGRGPGPTPSGAPNPPVPVFAGRRAGDPKAQAWARQVKCQGAF